MKMAKDIRLHDIAFAGLSLILSLLVLLADPPFATYTDAYYHANAAGRLANGFGLTDEAIWTTVNAPDRLPATGVTPSYLYWMPLTAIVAGSSQAAGLSAQVVFMLFVWGAGLVAYRTTLRLGVERPGAWAAGLLVIGGGFYARYWAQADTFAIYAFIGSSGLLVQGYLLRAIRDRSAHGCLLAAAAGALAGLAHLARPDGLLALLTAIGGIALVALHTRRWRTSAGMAVIVIAAYSLFMLPWWARNLSEIGQWMPPGGLQSALYASYDQIVDWPPGATIPPIAASDWRALLEVRLDAAFGGSLLGGNFGTWLAVETLVIFAPVSLIALWRRRRDVFLWPLALFAIGLHFAMTVVFPLPGVRGGLLHGSVALFPWWMALGIAGIADSVVWVSRRRRSWNVTTARRIFWIFAVVCGMFISVLVMQRSIPAELNPQALYPGLERVPTGARIMSNDPAGVYFWLDHGGFVVPNAEPEAIVDLADRFQLDYLYLDRLALPRLMQPIWQRAPAFLRLIDESENWRLYAIDADTPAP
jgi:hypothetical protein